MQARRDISIHPDVQTETTSRFVRSVGGPGLLIVVCLATYWIGNGQTSLWDRDEPRYAGTARTMLASGDFVVPYFNGSLRFQKPILTYWLIALAYQLCGVTEFAARCFSGVAIAAACAIVWRLGDRMFGPPAGGLAATSLAVAPVVVFLGKLSIPDAPQFLFAVVCYSMLYKCLSPPVESELRHARAATWFWIALGLATLTKGPIVAGMVAASLLAFKLLTNIGWSEIRLQWGRGLLILALVIGPWLAAIVYAAGPPFLRESLGNQLARRVALAFDGRFLPPGYYVATLAVGLGPVLSFAILAAVRWRGEWQQRRPVAFLLAWILGPIVLLECFQSKQMHYYAPAYPAFALLAGGYASDVLRSRIAWIRDGHTVRCAWFCGALGLILSTIFLLLGALGPSSTAVGAVGCGAILAVAAVTSAWCFMHGYVLVTFAVSNFALAIVWMAVGGCLLPRFESQRVVRPLAESLANRSRETGRGIVLHRLVEPSMTFYAQMNLPDCYDRPVFAARVLSLRADSLTAMTDAELQYWSQRHPGRFVIEQTWRGWVKMHRDVVHIVRVVNSVDAAILRTAAVSGEVE